MKNLMIIGLLCAILTVKAQNKDSLNHQLEIPPAPLDITWHKTTMLIFPYPIQSADRGDRYVLAEKVKGVENVLKVKAGQAGFEESNLQVITSDGAVYSFTVNYLEHPAYQTLDFRGNNPIGVVHFRSLSLNSKDLSDYTSIVTGTEPFLKHIRYSANGVKLKMNGIYLKDDVLFFRFKLQNSTALKYDISSVRFFIRDQKRAKRTAEQDQEIKPLYLKYYSRPEDKGGEIIVAALNKFTIAEHKNFVVEFLEQNGDRNPGCKIDQRKLLKAKALL